MRIVFLFFLVFISLILESTLFTELTLFNIKPDLLLIYTSLFALQKGRRQGGMFGFGVGLVEDLFVAKFIGMNALIKAIAGLGIGALEKRIYKENIFVPIIVVAVGTVIAGLGFYLFSLILNVPVSLSYFKTIMLPTLLYNIILTPLIKVLFFRTKKRRY